MTRLVPNSIHQTTITTTAACADGKPVDGPTYVMYKRVHVHRVRVLMYMHVCVCINTRPISVHGLHFPHVRGPNALTSPPPFSLNHPNHTRLGEQQYVARLSSIVVAHTALNRYVARLKAAKAAGDAPPGQVLDDDLCEQAAEEKGVRAGRGQEEMEEVRVVELCGWVGGWMDGWMDGWMG
jgi:hypothetical protein